MSRDTMVYYRSFRESLRELPPDLYKVVSETIFDYAFEGIAPGPDSNAVAKALFIAIKPVIDNAHNRYDACVENGRKGGAPKGSRNNPSGKAIQPNQRPNQYPNQEPNLYKDKDVDKDKDIESKGGAGGSGKSNVGNTPKGTSADKPRKVAAKRAAFVAPSLQEVKNYISEKGDKRNNRHSRRNGPRQRYYAIVGCRAGHPRRLGTTPTGPTSGRVHRHSYGLTTARRADGRLEGRPARGIGWPSRDGQKCRNATFCPDRRRCWGSGVRVFAGDARYTVGRANVGRRFGS